MAATDGPALGIAFCAKTTCVEPDESGTGMSAPTRQWSFQILSGVLPLILFANNGVIIYVVDESLHAVIEWRYAADCRGSVAVQ